MKAFKFACPECSAQYSYGSLHSRGTCMRHPDATRETAFLHCAWQTLQSKVSATQCADLRRRILFSCFAQHLSRLAHLSPMSC